MTNEIECSLCGEMRDCYDANELGEILLGYGQFQLCQDCLNQVAQCVSRAWRSKRESKNA